MSIGNGPTLLTIYSAGYGGTQKPIDTRILNIRNPDHITIFWLSHLTRVVMSGACTLFFSMDRSLIDDRHINFDLLLDFFENMQGCLYKLQLDIIQCGPVDSLDGERIFRRIESLPLKLTLNIDAGYGPCHYPVGLLAKTPFHLTLWYNLPTHESPPRSSSFYFSCAEKTVMFTCFGAIKVRHIDALLSHYGAIKNLVFCSPGTIDCEGMSYSLFQNVESVVFYSKCTLLNVSFEVFKVILEVSFIPGCSLSVSHNNRPGLTIACSRDRGSVELEGWENEDFLTAAVYLEMEYPLLLTRFDISADWLLQIRAPAVLDNCTVHFTAGSFESLRSITRLLFQPGVFLLIDKVQKNVLVFEQEQELCISPSNFKLAGFAMDPKFKGPATFQRCRIEIHYHSEAGLPQIVQALGLSDGEVDIDVQWKNIGTTEATIGKGNKSLGYVVRFLGWSTFSIFDFLCREMASPTTSIRLNNICLDSNVRKLLSAGSRTFKTVAIEAASILNRPDRCSVAELAQTFPNIIGKHMDMKVQISGPHVVIDRKIYLRGWDITESAEFFLQFFGEDSEILVQKYDSCVCFENEDYHVQLDGRRMEKEWTSFVKKMALKTANGFSAFRFAFPDVEHSNAFLIDLFSLVEFPFFKSVTIDVTITGSLQDNGLAPTDAQKEPSLSLKADDGHEVKLLTTGNVFTALSDLLSYPDSPIAKIFMSHLHLTNQLLTGIERINHIQSLDCVHVSGAQLRPSLSKKKLQTKLLRLANILKAKKTTHVKFSGHMIPPIEYNK